MKTTYLRIILALLLTFTFSCTAFLTSCISTPPKKDTELLEKLSEQDISGSDLSLDEPLPIDTHVKVGKLENGLTYYIRSNKQPENRAELRLVVNAGSLLEDEDQQGLAHFLEHMAFNSTKHFARQEIVNYLESIGMRFGPDLNAYTTFDETVYKLQVPTDNQKTLETAMQILEDWAQYIIFEEEDIDKERGVVVEEWRMRRDAEARMREKQYQILFYNSRYSERMPIGKMDIIRSFKTDTLIRFYKDWYRPDLMAVIAAGDFEMAMMERMIKKYFLGLKPVKDSRTRTIFPVPDHDETLVGIASDAEATKSRVSIITKHDIPASKTVADYRRYLIEALYNGMLNVRLDELSRAHDPPILSGYSAIGRIVRNKDFYILGAQVKDSGIIRGLKALLTEAERVKRFGFTISELDRQKKELLKGIEQLYNERDKIESSDFASEYIRHYLENEPIPGIEYEFELFQKYIPGIQLDEVNQLADEWLMEKNRVILAYSPKKAEIQLPDQDDLLEVINLVKNKEVLPYKDEIADMPLVPVSPVPGRIIEEKLIEEIGITEWGLSNGVQVILKKTDFKNDEVLFSAFSPGGHSLVPDDDYVAAISATSLIEEGGVGNFNLTQLEKKLAGKAVTVSPWIDELYEGIRGSSTPEDMETMFQLIYLYFTRPRMDKTAFLTVRNRLEALVKNREASPEEFFWDSVRKAVAQNHYRAQPWNREMLAEMDLEKSYNFYLDRFADASDFTFFFVGNFTLEHIKPLIETYLGGLPSTGRDETWQDLGIDPPAGIVKETIMKGIDPKSMVQIVFNGTFDWTLENAFMFTALEDVLDIPIRESLREDKGGTYSTWVYTVLSRFPDEEYYIYIGFGSAPEQAAELVELVFKEILRLQTEGPKMPNINKVKEILRRERETKMRQNEFWLRILQSYYIQGLDPVRMLEYDMFIDELTAEKVQVALKKYLDRNRYVQVILYPENWTGND